MAFVEADRPLGGCAAGFWLQRDAAERLEVARAVISASGTVLTSHGGLRTLDAELTPTRSPVSLHYLGRAIDLCITSGMQGPDDPYLVIQDGIEDGFPLWRVLGVIGSDRAAASSDTDAAAVGAVIWTGRPGEVLSSRPRVGAFVDLTAMLEAASWQRIPARPGWETDYTAVEWWHFEYREGLQPGVSTFGEELLELYDDANSLPEAVARCFNHVWSGRRFEPPA